MKYRIKQINDTYYPQFRLLFFWHNYERGAYERGAYETDLSFTSLPAAREFLEQQFVDDNPKITIHPWP